MCISFAYYAYCTVKSSFMNPCTVYCGVSCNFLGLHEKLNSVSHVNIIFITTQHKATTIVAVWLLISILFVRVCQDSNVHSCWNSQVVAVVISLVRTWTFHSVYTYSLHVLQWACPVYSSGSSYPPTVPPRRKYKTATPIPSPRKTLPAPTPVVRSRYHLLHMHTHVQYILTHSHVY